MNASTRRTVLKALGLCSATMIQPSMLAQASQPLKLVKKYIPSSGEPLTAIGMGTWQTFNVGSDDQLRHQRSEVLKTFYGLGGQLIDSSPMYGSSQEVVGHSLSQMRYPSDIFSAEKIWTRSDDTQQQAAGNARKWGIRQFDLLQVHNLLNWRHHLEQLQEMKHQGRLRYVGVTTSHGRRHSNLERIMETQSIDFVQLTYNLLDRDAERRLLPLARERGIAVIINRPFQGGALIDRLQSKNRPLPTWAKEFSCHNWPQFLLKYIISHPAVTCAIPATRQLIHMQENMGAAIGPLPSPTMREKMSSYVAGI